MWAGILLVALVAGELTGDRNPRPQPLPCPSSAEVKSELGHLGALAVVSPEIVVVGERMTVVLHGRDGAVVGNREVEAPAGRRERATVAAVVVASWMGIWPEGAPPEARPAPAATAGAATISGPPPLRGGHELGPALLGAYDGNDSALGILPELRRELVAPVSGGVSGSVGTGGRTGVGDVGGAAAVGAAGRTQGSGGSGSGGQADTGGSAGTSTSSGGSTSAGAGASGGGGGASGGAPGGAAGVAADKSGWACVLAAGRAGTRDRGFGELGIVALCALAWVRRRRLRR
jgi:hypothetical protein